MTRLARLTTFSVRHFQSSLHHAMHDRWTAWTAWIQPQRCKFVTYTHTPIHAYTLHTDVRTEPRGTKSRFAYWRYVQIVLQWNSVTRKEIDSIANILSVHFPHTHHCRLPSLIHAFAPGLVIPPNPSHYRLPVYPPSQAFTDFGTVCGFLLYSHAHWFLV